MDDITAFDQQIAREVLREAGPSEPVDAAAILSSLTTVDRSPWWGFQTMFSPTRFAAAGAIVALFGGVLLSSVVLQQQPDQPPAAGAVSPTASASPPASTPWPEASAAMSPDSDVPDDAITMGPGRDVRLGGYRQVGRIESDAFAPDSIVGVVGTVTIDDRLVMAVAINDHSVILRTTDGRTWLPSAVPGSVPWIDDLAATADGLLAVGHDGGYGAWQARLWASEDGEAWTTLEAPPDIALTRIVSASDPLAVTSFDWLWVQEEDGEWVKGPRLTNMTLSAGPGGYLGWDDRAGEGARAFLMHSTDLVEWDDVDLSASPSLAEAVGAGDIAIYATGEEWVFVPSRSRLPDTIFTSDDGLVWQEAPRPPRMDRPSWIAAVGDEVHAFESLENGNRLLWTWQRGESAGSPERAGPGHGRALGWRPPVEWQGDWVSLVFEGPAPTRDVTLWRYEGDTDEG